MAAVVVAAVVVVAVAAAAAAAVVYLSKTNFITAFVFHNWYKNLVATICLYVSDYCVQKFYDKPCNVRKLSVFEMPIFIFASSDEAHALIRRDLRYS